MLRARFILGFASGLVAAVLLTGTLAGADRYKFHRNADPGEAICMYKPGEPWKCNGGVPEADGTVLVTADEIDRMVQGAKNYCDAQIAHAQGEFIKALEAQKAEILKELGQRPQPPPKAADPKKPVGP
jgi:hypothetical protein